MHPLLHVIQPGGHLVGQLLRLPGHLRGEPADDADQQQQRRPAARARRRAPAGSPRPRRKRDGRPQDGGEQQPEQHGQQDDPELAGEVAEHHQGRDDEQEAQARAWPAWRTPPPTTASRRKDSCGRAGCRPGTGAAASASRAGVVLVDGQHLRLGSGGVLRSGVVLQRGLIGAGHGADDAPSTATPTPYAAPYATPHDTGHAAGHAAPTADAPRAGPSAVRWRHEARPPGEEQRDVTGDAIAGVREDVRRFSGDDGRPALDRLADLARRLLHARPRRSRC